MIWKYPVASLPVDVPRGGKAVYVGAQGRGVFIWIMVEPDVILERRTFTFVGTGGLCPDGSYVGTCQDDYGYVWHVFETTP